MSKLQRASLVICFLLYSIMLIDRAYNLGRDTEHNRLLWIELNRTEPRRVVADPEERDQIFENQKRSTIFNVKGDLQ